MNVSQTNGRLDYLDAVRAFALLLGIVFHASLSFLPMFIGWAVMDVSTSMSVGAFITLSHSFRMPLFFLIAGFFSHRVFHGKGSGVFLKSRLVRIGIPFVVGWFILKPLLVSGWVMGMVSMNGDVDVLAGLKAGFASMSELPAGIFVGSHLWFLYYLLMVTAIILGLRYLLMAWPRMYKVLTRGVDRVVARASGMSCLPVLLGIPTALCLWFMNGWGMDTPDKSLAPQFAVVLIYGGFFLLGWILDRQPEQIVAFARLTIGRMVLGVLAAVGCLFFSRYQLDPGHPHLMWMRAGFVFAYGLMMWSFVGITIGLFKRFFDKPSGVVRYMADASYWLYLVHLPIVVWLQIAFAELEMHWSLKLVAIVVITVGVSLLMYDLFVRSTLIGKVLNGRRKARAVFALRKKTSMATVRNGEA